MPLRDTEAFVLRSYTLKEADKICVFLARDAGKIRGVAHGARKLRSRFGASLEPFTEVSLSYFEQENRELVSISSCDIIRSQFADSISSERLAALHYLSELLLEFLPDHEPNETVYRLVRAALDALRKMPDEKPGALLRYCEVWILKLSGFFPDWRGCAECGDELRLDTPVWLSPDSAPLCERCSGKLGDPIDPNAQLLVRDILRMPPSDFINRPVHPRALGAVEAMVAKIIQNTLERQLRSNQMIARLRPV